jgi:hypothetical protein
VVQNKIPTVTAALVTLALLIVPPFLYPAGLLTFGQVSPGFFIFFSWVALLVTAVLGRWLIVWAVLSLVPVCALAAAVWADWRFFTNTVDSYGFYPWGATALFTGMCLAIAGTGTLSILLAAMNGRAIPR